MDRDFDEGDEAPTTLSKTGTEGTDVAYRGAWGVRRHEQWCAWRHTLGRLLWRWKILEAPLGFSDC
ncbi:hypothetical protein EPI10_000331 [Gossypium australe]|uniref:Uncharacterized protein n=1 Tax=Gossypium australe TaxID=47621 RepID=A0A5B6V7J5_9ROSI|nr:hypothetical protein EPI10_000331 [Gossypium australe]